MIFDRMERVSATIEQFWLLWIDSCLKSKEVAEASSAAGKLASAYTSEENATEGV